MSFALYIFFFLKVPEKPKLKCLGFTYNGANLFNMLPIQMKKIENPNTFKTMTKDWIWENIPSYQRSVNFKMSFWCHRLDKNTNEKISKISALLSL